MKSKNKARAPRRRAKFTSKVKKSKLRKISRNSRKVNRQRNK